MFNPPNTLHKGSAKKLKVILAKYPEINQLDMTALVLEVYEQGCQDGWDACTYESQ